MMAPSQSAPTGDRDIWAAYWQAVDTHFQNRHEITEKSRKLRNLRYTGGLSDYLVNLRDLNQVVTAAGQAFRDQVEAQLPDDIITMMYMLGRSLTMMTTSYKW
jgi:hypothetical protein